MAARYSFKAKAHAFERAVLFDCFGCVFRTTWEETAAAPKKGADHIFVDADQCQQQAFHRLIVQVRSFFPASPGFLAPEPAGRVHQVWLPSVKSGRATPACSASNGNARVPNAAPSCGQPSGAEIAWQRPSPNGRQVLLRPTEGGNVTGNVCSSAPS